MKFLQINYARKSDYRRNRFYQELRKRGDHIELVHCIFSSRGKPYVMFILHFYRLEIVVRGWRYKLVHGGTK